MSLRGREQQYKSILLVNNVSRHLTQLTWYGNLFRRGLFVSSKRDGALSSRRSKDTGGCPSILHEEVLVAVGAHVSYFSSNGCSKWLLDDDDYLRYRRGFMM
jgi:hypothetical protein